MTSISRDGQIVQSEEHHTTVADDEPAFKPVEFTVLKPQPAPAASPIPVQQPVPQAPAPIQQVTKPVQQPPQQVPRPAQQPPQQVPRPAQQPPQQVPRPAQQPPQQAPRPAQQPPQQAPRPAQQTPQQAPGSTQPTPRPAQPALAKPAAPVWAPVTQQQVPAQQWTPSRPAQPRFTSPSPQRPRYPSEPSTRQVTTTQYRSEQRLITRQSPSPARGGVSRQSDLHITDTTTLMRPSEFAAAPRQTGRCKYWK